MYATLKTSDSLAASHALGREVDTDESAATAVALPFLEEQVCAEAGLWAPDLARRAIAQARGDLARAVSLLRVWAATLPHGSATPLASTDQQLVRRVSATFADVPGGQWLGASLDTTSRLLDLEDNPADEPTGGLPRGPQPVPIGASSVPTRASRPRVREALTGVPLLVADGPEDGPDPMIEPITAPVSRAAALALLARGETGALVALASMALAHRREAVLIEAATIRASIRVPHPRTGTPCRVLDIPLVEAEAVVDADVEGRPGLALGWGCSLGTLERRAGAIAVLDGTLQVDDGQLTGLDTESTVQAADGLATSGFVEHLRLPHYASFASYLDQLRRAAAPPPSGQGEGTDR